jgi:hypothetical protein
MSDSERIAALEDENRKLREWGNAAYRAVRFSYERRDIVLDPRAFGLDSSVLDAESKRPIDNLACDNARDEEIAALRDEEIDVLREYIADRQRKIDSLQASLDDVDKRLERAELILSEEY